MDRLQSAYLAALFEWNTQLTAWTQIAIISLNRGDLVGKIANCLNASFNQGSLVLNTPIPRPHHPLPRYHLWSLSVFYHPPSQFPIIPHLCFPFIPASFFHIAPISVSHQPLSHVLITHYLWFPFPSCPRSNRLFPYPLSRVALFCDSLLVELGVKLGFVVIDIENVDDDVRGVGSRRTPLILNTYGQLVLGHGLKIQFLR